MQFKFLIAPVSAILASFVIAALPSALAETKAGTYVDWGIDEYEFFGLTKNQVTKKFAGRLCFHEGFERVHFKGGSGLNYYGPTFKLGFKNGKVDAVQGIFEGCRDTIYRPQFNSKKEALKFACDGLADAKDDAGKKKLAAARKELATVAASP